MGLNYTRLVLAHTILDSATIAFCTYMLDINVHFEQSSDVAKPRQPPKTPILLNFQSSLETIRTSALTHPSRPFFTFISSRHRRHGRLRRFFGFLLQFLSFIFSAVVPNIPDKSNSDDKRKYFQDQIHR